MTVPMCSPAEGDWRITGWEAGIRLVRVKAYDLSLEGITDVLGSSGVGFRGGGSAALLEGGDQQVEAANVDAHNVSDRRRRMLSGWRRRGHHLAGSLRHRDEGGGWLRCWWGGDGGDGGEVARREGGAADWAGRRGAGSIRVHHPVSIGHNCLIVSVRGGSQMSLEACLAEFVTARKGDGGGELFGAVGAE